MSRRRGFIPGMGVGMVGALAGVVLLAPASGAEGYRELARWLVQNLGSSGWLFAAVMVLFIVHLLRLRRLLDVAPDHKTVVELDQLTDVWTHLFIGIGVIWTAVGMRSALQLALADPQHVLADSAGSMLKRLVDGGILLALSTTIVGAIGGYLLRLAKTLYVGAALHEYYERIENRELRELLTTVQRLERRLAGTGGAEETDRAPL